MKTERDMALSRPKRQAGVKVGSPKSFTMHHAEAMLTEIEKIAGYSEEFLKRVKGKKFKHPDTGNRVLFTSLPAAEQKRVHQQMSKATGKPEKTKARSELTAEEAIALLQQRALDFKPSAENRRGLQRMLKEMGIEGITVRAPMKDTTKKKAYSEEFMRWAENMSFTNPDTGNKVKFVSLPPERQAQIHAQYEAGRQKAQEQAAQKAEKKPKKPKRPTFPQARDQAYGALEEAGWSLKKGLKVPKAEREIDGERVILHFHPQAVWMEVKNKTPARSLHTDIRDVDPKQWAESLAGEARSMLDLEDRLNKMATMRTSAVMARKYSATQQGFHVTPKEKSRASKDGVTIIVRPQENGNHGVFAVDVTDQHQVGNHWYEVESKQEIPTAVRQLNRALHKFHGRGDQMSERSRHRVAQSEDNKMTMQDTDKMMIAIEKAAAHSKEFLSWARGKKFHNPATGNKVVFVSLPKAEQAKIHAQWAAQQKAKPGTPPDASKSKSKDTLDDLHEVFWPGGDEDHEWDNDTLDDVARVIGDASPDDKTPEGRTLGQVREVLYPGGDEDHEWDSDTLGDVANILHSSKKTSASKQASMGTQMNKQDRLKKARARWAQMSPKDRDAMRRAFGDMLQGPVVHAQPVPGQSPHPGEEPPEPPPPAEVKRMLADRMRDVARTLMMAGMKQPRQQMVEIAKALDILFEQLDMLADQPGRDALRRRIFMTVRQRISSPGGRAASDRGKAA